MAQLSGSAMADSGGDGAALELVERPVGVEVSPALLAMQVKGPGLIAASRTVILNHTASDMPVQIAPDTTGYFDWPSGTLTAPAYGGLPIMVRFEGGAAPGSYRTSVRITAGQGAEFTVPVIVAVLAAGLVT